MPSRGMTRTTDGEYIRPSQAHSPLWPGWTDDGDGTCKCSWSYLNGVRQVKFANRECPVRHKERAADG